MAGGVGLAYKIPATHRAVVMWAVVATAEDVMVLQI